MIVYRPRVSRSGSRAIIRSYIEVERRPGLSREVWFDVPAHAVAERQLTADPFVAGVLPLAMSLREPVHAEGSLSPKLRYGLQQYQQYFTYWFHELLNQVDVTADAYEEDTAGTQQRRGAAGFFSGGVDSFYTLREHLSDRLPNVNDRINYGVFIHGFDIPLADERTYRLAHDHYAGVLSNLGVELIGVRTNLRELLHHSSVRWDMTHGAALGTVGLVLRSTLSRVYVPSSWPYSVTAPLGSNPTTDPVFATECFETIHHGAHLSRLQKTREISSWPATYESLRVCWIKPDGLQNCCRCEKCLRTMAALELEGVLDQYTTFPKPLLGSWKKWKLVEHFEYTYHRDLMQLARELGRDDLVQLLKDVESRSQRLGGVYRLRHELLVRIWYAYLRGRDRWRQWIVRQRRIAAGH